MFLRFLSRLFLKISKTYQLLNFRLLRKNNYILPNTQSFVTVTEVLETPGLLAADKLPRNHT